MEYVELHARSAFSFLRGASLPEDLAEACAGLELPAAAILDLDGVYGAPRFHLAMKRQGLRAHVGAEVTLDMGLGPGTSATAEPPRLPLLCASRQGYQNLCRLITRMKLRAPKNTPSPSNLGELPAFTEGLLCLTGDEHGPLAQALARGGMEEARRCLQHLLRIFGYGNVYAELQRHFDRAQERRNQAVVELAQELGLPLLATSGASYAQPRHCEVLDVFTCIRHHTTLAQAGRLLQRNRERFLRSPQEMARLFADLPEALANSVELSSRLQFTLEDLGYKFPQYPVPEGETMASFLRQRTEEGARLRYLIPAKRHLWPRAQRQIERELTLIGKLGLEGYFLIVWDLVRFCREHGILVQGRGSAANSAVCYSLGITAVDAVGMDLLFERFLSEERGEWPDIDLDLPSGDDRERVIQYLYQRYGKLGAAMTANVITYRGRSAAREVGKVLGLDHTVLDRVAGMVSPWEYKDAADTMETQFRQAGVDLRHPRIRKFFELCLAVQEMPRHLGQHSGGMVICQGQLDSVVPLEPATMPGRVVVQWDKDDCADLGIIKVDLLGLGMMAVIKDCLNIIRDDYREEVDLSQLPPDDPAVYGAIQKADTVGVFQIESRAQMSCLPRTRPVNFYDLVVQVAIIRPGPIVGKMVNPYIQRRQGREAVTYAHPALEPILERTLGVPLFQEQLLRIAMVVANFTGGEAEELRRALGTNKRLHEKMRAIEIKLRQGMTANGIAAATQEQILQGITSFALYGFPESHSASFALLAYASAWLKTHYLAAFTAAILNNQPMGFYSPATLVKDAQRHGLKVLPIDVGRSQWECTLEAAEQSTRGDWQMRLGLRYVRGLRQEAAQALLQAREHRAFDSVEDLAQRVPQLDQGELVSLASVGALNGITHKERAQQHRRDALWQVARASHPEGALLRHAIAERTPNEQKEEGSPLLRMTPDERLIADYDGTGMTVGPHPMAYRRAQMQEMGVRTAAELARLPNGKTVTIAGNVICRQRPGTASGFVFLSVEDETGIANAIVTPDLFGEYRLMLVREPFLLIEGTLQNLDNVISVKVQALRPLTVVEAEFVSHDFR